MHNIVVKFYFQKKFMIGFFFFRCQIVQPALLNPLFKFAYVCR